MLARMDGYRVGKFRSEQTAAATRRELQGRRLLLQGRQLCPWPVETDACRMVLRFTVRESIFLFPHTNEFCGKSKVAREPTVACTRVNVGRCTYERGARVLKAKA